MRYRTYRQMLEKSHHHEEMALGWLARRLDHFDVG
jgi:hypothetical protein